MKNYYSIIRGFFAIVLVSFLGRPTLQAQDNFDEFFI